MYKFLHQELESIAETKQKINAGIYSANRLGSTFLLGVNFSKLRFKFNEILIKISLDWCVSVSVYMCV